MHVAPHRKHLKPDAAPGLHEGSRSRQQHEEVGHVARLVDPDFKNLGLEWGKGTWGTVA